MVHPLHLASDGSLGMMIPHHTVLQHHKEGNLLDMHHAHNIYHMHAYVYHACIMHVSTHNTGISISVACYDRLLNVCVFKNCQNVLIK